MLKITLAEENSLTITLKLEGRIVGPWIRELENECKKCLSQRSELILDLSGVRYADGPGTRALKLMGKHVRLTGASPFLAELLKSTADAN